MGAPLGTGTGTTVLFERLASEYAGGLRDPTLEDLTVIGRDGSIGGCRNWPTLDLVSVPLRGGCHGHGGGPYWRVAGGGSGGSGGSRALIRPGGRFKLRRPNAGGGTAPGLTAFKYLLSAVPVMYIGFLVSSPFPLPPPLYLAD